MRTKILRLVLALFVCVSPLFQLLSYDNVSAFDLSMGVQEGAGSVGGGGVTSVEFDHVATGTGYITSITFDVYPGYTVNGLVIGSAYARSSNRFTCRSCQAIGSGYTAGQHTVTGLNMYVVSGDYLMIYTSGTTVSYRSHAGGGWYWDFGNKITPGTSFSYGYQSSNYMFSLIGQGNCWVGPVNTITIDGVSSQAIVSVDSVTYSTVKSIDGVN